MKSEETHTEGQESPKSPIVSADVGIVAELFEACLTLLQQSPPNARELSKLHERSLQRSTQCLYLWGDSHEVSNGSLDLLLQKSGTLMKLVVANLRSLLMTTFYGTKPSGSIAAWLN
jgi:hypothetical protein